MRELRPGSTNSGAFPRKTGSVVKEVEIAQVLLIGQKLVVSILVTWQPSRGTRKLFFAQILACMRRESVLLLRRLTIMTWYVCRRRTESLADMKPGRAYMDSSTSFRLVLPLAARELES